MLIGIPVNPESLPGASESAIQKPLSSQFADDACWRNHAIKENTKQYTADNPSQYSRRAHPQSIGRSEVSRPDPAAGYPKDRDGSQTKCCWQRPMLKHPEEYKDSENGSHQERETSQLPRGSIQFSHFNADVFNQAHELSSSRSGPPMEAGCFWPEQVFP